jgi:hypothetical protein
MAFFILCAQQDSEGRKPHPRHYFMHLLFVLFCPFALFCTLD